MHFHYGFESKSLMICKKIWGKFKTMKKGTINILNRILSFTIMIDNKGIIVSEFITNFEINKQNTGIMSSQTESGYL